MSPRVPWALAGYEQHWHVQADVEGRSPGTGRAQYGGRQARWRGRKCRAGAGLWDWVVDNGQCRRERERWLMRLNEMGKR